MPQISRRKSKRVAAAVLAKRWAASKIEQWPVARLKPYERNARLHSDEQIEQLRASLREFGWTIPVLVREDGTIIAGHGRVTAAKLDGYDKVPVIVARLEEGWTEERCRAYTVADNKLGLNSDWDDELLGQELDALDDLGVALEPLGFNDTELDRLLPGEQSSDASAQLTGLSYSIVLRCRDEAHQGELLARFEEEGLTCEALIS